MIEGLNQTVEVPLWMLFVMWSYRGEAAKFTNFLREVNGIRRIKKRRRENETPDGSRD